MYNSRSINCLTKLSSLYIYKINILMSNIENDIKTFFTRYIVTWKISHFRILL